jgi:23S rRNA pseudouridine2605 synthase
LMNGATLLQALTAAGLGSRRRLADAIKQGKVTRNGQVVTDFRQPVLEDDVIAINGRQVSLQAEAKTYIMLNKPVGVLSASIDKRGGRTALDILPPQYRRLRLYPAGRLDKDSSGLLLLTNDGGLTYRLTHPSFEREKEYLIYIKKELTADEIAGLKDGLMLEDGLTAPAGVSKVSETPYNYSVTIHEGRKRQVRRMLAALGYPVLALKRVRLGNLKLGSLKEGEARALSAAEAGKALE